MIQAILALRWFLVYITFALLLLSCRQDSTEWVNWHTVDVSGTSSSGDAHLLEFSTGEYVLIDTGYARFTKADLIPYLTSLGIDRLDLIVITHAHKNHYGGLRYLAEQFEIDEVLISAPDAQLCAKESKGKRCELEHISALIEDLKGSTKINRVPDSGIIFATRDRSASLSVVYQAADDTKQLGGFTINETSAVLKLNFAGNSVLFPGDIGPLTGAKLAYSHADLIKSTLLAAPHHGVSPGPREEFFDAVQAQAVIASVSQPPFQGVRGQFLKDYVAAKNIPLRSTSVEGTLVTKLTQDGYTIKSAAKPIPKIYFSNRYDVVEHPTDILFADGQFWLAQMKSRRLKRFSDFEQIGQSSYIEVSDPIASPHFLAAADGVVFVSEGRGSLIRQFSTRDSYAEIPLKIPTTLQRPHGICVKDQWLYIADSVGSRLVRFHLETGTTEVFADYRNQVAYGRQLLCRDDGLWLSNSYEKAFDLNPGRGSNVLRIADWDSGVAEVIVAFPDTNTTGIAVLDHRVLLVGRWSTKRDLVAVDLLDGKLLGTLLVSNENLDAPYGIYVDETNRRFYVTFLGIHPNAPEGKNGAILEWRYE